MEIKKLSALFLTLGLISNAAFAVCAPPTKENYINYYLSVRGKDVVKQKQLFEQYCYAFDSSFFKQFKMNNPLFQAQNVETIKFLESKNIVLDNVFTKELNLDLFSYKLIYSKIAVGEFLDYQNQKFTEDYKKFNPNSTSKLNLEIDRKDETKLLDYLALQYKRSYSVNKDNYGNSALSYAILTNRPEYIESSYSSSGSKLLFTAKNKDGFSPLHLLFSPDLAKENTAALNDKVLSIVPVDYMLYLKNDGLNFFQYAELMKENNLDLYNKLKTKYNFKNPTFNIDPHIKPNYIRQLPYIARIKATLWSK